MNSSLTYCCKTMKVSMFVLEGKQETSDDVCRLADNYVAAHKSGIKPEHDCSQNSSKLWEEKKET